MSHKMPRRMKTAGIFGIPFDIRVVEILAPALPSDGFILKVKTCGLCNSEVKMARRGHPMLQEFPVPFVAGHEFSGDVVEVGPKLKGIAVGDRLVVMSLVPCGYCPPCRRGRPNLCDNYFKSLLVPGGFAPYVAVGGDTLRRRVFKIPDGVPYEHAAMAEPIACVINGVERSGVLPGDSVAILGAGFMGLLLTSLVSSAGAAKIIVIDNVPERLDLARQMGASHSVNFDQMKAKDAVRDITSGAMVDIAIEATGNPEAYEQAFHLAGKGGRVVYFGGVPSGSTIKLDPNKIHYSEVEVTGAANPKPIHVDRALELLAAGRLDVSQLITHRMDALDLKAAMELASKKQAIKIMLAHGE